LIPLEKLESTIPKSMLKKGLTVLSTELKPMKILIEQKRVPEEGWKDDLIERFLDLLSTMDSDKDSKVASVGEREGRVASPLVSKLAAGFHHGVGRSGQLVAPQPKAAGCSLMYYFANRLATYAMKSFGVPNIKKAYVVPMATGMTIGLALSVARDSTCGKEVVCPRADHESPLKAIRLVGLKAKTVEGKVFEDAVRVSTEDVEEAISEETCAILSTTTFFPPREPDNVKEIAKIAAREDVPHIINNAYGVQSREIMKMIRGSIDAGRVDAIIQSTDKNFLTPVGGAVVASPNEDFLDRISKAYAGRASASPIVQFLASMLSLGVKGYEELRDEREENWKMMGELLKDVAEKHGERLLNVYNPISVAMTMTKKSAKKIGKVLYASRVTGARALDSTDFGVCCPKYITSYINFDVTIQTQRKDVVLATKRLDKVLATVK